MTNWAISYWAVIALILLRASNSYAVDGPKLSPIRPANTECGWLVTSSGKTKTVPIVIEERVHTEGSAFGNAKPGDKYLVGRTWDYTKSNDRTYRFSDTTKETEVTDGPSDWIVTKTLTNARFEITRKEGQALNFYQGEGFKQINSYLRNPAPILNSVNKQIEASVQLIDNVFSRLPTLPLALTLFRGMPLDPNIGVPKVGQIFQDAGFLSTASDKENADAFVFGLPGAEYPGVEKELYAKEQSMDISDLHINARASQLSKTGLRLVFHLPAGDRALTFQYFLRYPGSGVVTKENEGSIKTESEILLARNRAFKVTQIDPPEIVTTAARADNGELTEASATVYTVHLYPL